MKVKKCKFGYYRYRVRFAAWQDYCIYICIGDDLVHMVECEYGKHTANHHRDDDPLALTLRAESPNCHVFMLTDTIYKPYEMAKVLAHEVTHAIRNMFNWAGVDMEPVDSETFAYHTGYTVERATRFFQEVKNDQKRRTRTTATSQRRNRG